MPHAKKIVPFVGGLREDFSGREKGKNVVGYRLLDPQTSHPYTNKSIFETLQRNKGTYPALVPAIENEILEIARKAKEHPNAEFTRQCSADTEEKARKKAERELLPCLKGIAKLLFRPHWETLMTAGRPTVNLFVEYMGEDLFSSVKLSNRTNLFSALRTVILPVIGQKRLDELLVSEEKQKIKDKINKVLQDKAAGETLCGNAKRALRLLLQSIADNGYSCCTSVIELADSIALAKRQNRQLLDSVRLAYLDDEQRVNLFSLLSDKTHLHDCLIVALIYSGLDLSEISALRYENISRLVLAKENCYIVTVDKVTVGLDKDAASASYLNKDFAIQRLRKVVLYPWAASILMRYIEQLQKKVFSIFQIEKMRLSYSIDRQNVVAAAEMKATISKLLHEAGVPDIEVPRTKNGKTSIHKDKPDFSLLRRDAKYIATRCGANLPMLHAMFGEAWSEMDEMSYIDLLSDEYAVARYMRLKRFSPYCDTKLLRRVLKVQNTTETTQQFTISANYALSIKWKRRDKCND